MSKNKRLTDDLMGIRNLHWFHWVIIFLSLVLTLGAWYFTNLQLEQKNRLRFEKEADRLVALVLERMGKYEDALRSGVAAIHSQSQGIDYKEWKRFSDTLKIDTRYPGINGIGVIYYVKEENIDDFVQAERELRPEFNIKPALDEHRHIYSDFHSALGYWPITYIEPIKGNEAALGLDMTHEQNRLESAVKARDTGEPQITAPIQLVQDQEKTPGFLFYSPYYERESDISTVESRRENFIGLVYAPFIVNKLLEGTLRAENRNIGLSIYDDSEVIYDEHLDSRSDFDPNPMFTKITNVDLYGRSWHFDVRTGKSFRLASNNNQPKIILIGGILIDALIIFIIFTLSRSSHRSVVLANRMTRELKESENFQKMIKESNPDLIFVKDEEFKIIDANKSFLNVYPEEIRDSVIGSTTFESYSEEDVEIFLEQDKIAFKEGFSEITEKVEFPDGFVRTLFTKKTRFENEDGKPFILGVARDITEREQLVEKLTESNEELEKFAYIASHDLQEPIRMINNFTQLLTKNYSDKLDEDGKKYLDICNKSSKQMQALIVDLLEYGKITEEAEMYEDFNSKDAIDYIMQNLQQNIENTGAKIKFGKLPNLRGNPIRFSRVMQNLIGNAIKYQSDGSKPEVFVGAEDNGHEWLFTVKDNGIGMRPEYCQQIFSPFKRLHNKDEYPGTGMGLAICRKIVMNLGGKIWAESELGKGTTFYFTVPKAGN